MNITFTGGEIEVKIDHVGATAVARGGAQLLPEVGVQQRIGGDTERAPVQPTCLHALLRLHPVLDSVRMDVGRAASVHLRPSTSHVLLEHAPHPGR